MPFCKACGSDIGTASFCPKCGANQTATASPVAPPPAAAPSSEGLQENVAGTLSYAFGWITGIIFLLIDKRPFVKFHAAQSIVVFGFLFILRAGLFFTHGIGLGFALWLISVILWIFLMVKAYQHQLFRVPVAADIADGIAK
jgi:uncharacterized membrane protein